MLILNPDILQDRVALAPVLGKLVAESLAKPGIAEDKLAFGSHPHQVAHLYYPERAALRRGTAVLYVHGGGWYSGHPLYYRFVGQFFAALGFPTLLTGYRLAPEHRYPAQIEDSAAGLRAGLAAFAARGVALDGVILGGQSAGAQLSALLAYDGWAQSKLPLRGYYGISGPLSFADCSVPALQKMVADMMGEGVELSAADPSCVLRGSHHPPALLIHGDRDPLVDTQNSLTFAERLRRRGIPAQVELVPGGRHADLAALFVTDMPATRALKSWLAAHDL